MNPDDVLVVASICVAFVVLIGRLATGLVSYARKAGLIAKKPTERGV